MFTVDVEGDWGDTETRGIREALPKLLELLRQYHARATFFVVGNLVTEVRNVLPTDGVHEVGSHGLTHALLTKLAPAGVGHEVRESKLLLERAGYKIAGFRAPYLQRPAQLSELAAGAGYTYDASFGAVYPGMKSRRGGPPAWCTKWSIYQVASSTLRDGLTPFSLTYLRLYHPFGLRLMSPNACLFYCHLHEFLDETAGWMRLPFPLRQLHRRNSGTKSWEILENMLRMDDYRFVSCRDYLQNLQSKDAI